MLNRLLVILCFLGLILLGCLLTHKKIYKPIGADTDCVEVVHLYFGGLVGYNESTPVCPQ